MSRTVSQSSDASEREQFVRGTLRGAAVVAGALLAALLVWGRWDWAVGFGCGALVSLGNFRLIAHAVGGLAGSEARRGAGLLWKGALFRFAIAAAVLVAALLVFHASLPALVAGLVVTQAAMITLWLARALRSVG